MLFQKCVRVIEIILLGGVELNKLKLKEMDSNKVVYLYQPDGKGEGGEIVYVFSDSHATIAKQAEGDINGRYGHKAAKKVEEVVRENNLPLDFIQAWY
jgi:hypothetical protein